MTDTIAEIRARHERVTDQLAMRTTGIVYQEGRDAHADRATLLLALTEAQERAERAEEENREMRRLLRLYAIQHGTVTET